MEQRDQTGTRSSKNGGPEQISAWEAYLRRWRDLQDAQ